MTPKNNENLSPKAITESSDSNSEAIATCTSSSYPRSDTLQMVEHILCCTGSVCIYERDILSGGDDKQHGGSLDGDCCHVSSLHRCLSASSRYQVRQPPCCSPPGKSEMSPSDTGKFPIGVLTGVASYGALGHVSSSTSNSFILAHFGVNLTTNYPSIA